MPLVAGATTDRSVPGRDFGVCGDPSGASWGTPPQPHSRAWVADHLGLAADALTAATTQYGHVALTVVGNFLQQSSRELEGLLPDVDTYFSPVDSVHRDLDTVDAAIAGLAVNYFLKGVMPPATSPGFGLQLARYTYTVRHAQDLLEGLGA